MSTASDASSRLVHTLTATVVVQWMGATAIVILTVTSP